MGVERLVLLVQEAGSLPADIAKTVDVYVVAAEERIGSAMVLAESLRSEIPGLRVQLNCGGGKISNQLKKAYASGARAAVILEAEDTGFRFRRLDEESGAINITREELTDRLGSLIPGA